jgi:hypothetical protein
VTTIRWKEIILTLTPTHLSNSDIGLTSTPKLLGLWWNQNFSFYLFSFYGLNFAWMKDYVPLSALSVCLKTHIFIECIPWACVTFDVNAKWCWKKHTWVSPVSTLERLAYFQGSHESVTYLSGWHAIDDENTNSLSYKWKMHTVSENCSLCCTKHLIPHRRANCLKFHTHIFSQSHWASKKFTHLVQSWSRHCSLIQTNSRNLSLLRIKLKINCTPYLMYHVMKA